MSQLVKNAIELANNGKWAEAHDLVDGPSDLTAVWLHANLHREEGDESNAAYWYSKAGKPVSTLSFSEERQEILDSLN